MTHSPKTPTKVLYSSNARDAKDLQIQGFFDNWPSAPSEEQFRTLLHNAEFVELAIDVDAKRLVGFTYAHSDGYLSAYIPLLEVVPEMQHRGIGTELIRRLLARLGNFYMVDLTCDDDVVDFYSQFKMQHANGLMIRRPKALSQRSAV